MKIIANPPTPARPTYTLENLPEPVVIALAKVLGCMTNAAYEQIGADNLDGFWNQLNKALEAQDVPEADRSNCRAVLVVEG
jgi:hypothetical protein